MLYRHGKMLISNHFDDQNIFEQATKKTEEKYVVDVLLFNVENILINGTQLILDKAFKSNSFDKLSNDKLKYLVTAHLSHPLRKSTTVDYFKSHFDENLQLHKIYRYWDNDTIHSSIKFSKSA